MTRLPKVIKDIMNVFVRFYPATHFCNRFATLLKEKNADNIQQPAF